jgi:hypothetical protein
VKFPWQRIGHAAEIAGRVAIPVAESALPFVLPGPAGQAADQALAWIDSKISGRETLMKNNGMGTWMIKLLSLIPYVVGGIEQIHGDAKTGAEKKQLALEALGLAENAAAAADEKDAPAIQAAAALASTTIDGVKSVYNAVKGKGAAPAPVPVPDAPAATANLQ